MSSAAMFALAFIVLVFLGIVIYKSKSMVTKFAIWSLVLLVLSVVTGVQASWNNEFVDGKSSPDFNYWQDQYKNIAYNLATDKAVKEATLATSNEVKQVTVMQFNQIQQDGSTQLRVDRCQSCHAGLTNPQMTAENIIKIVDHKTIPTEQVAEYLIEHKDTLRAVKTLGVHPGISVETAPAHDLGVIHGSDFTYGIATEKSLTSQDTADYAVQKASMKLHPFPTFGCTTCHYGSGRDLVQDVAHGDPDKWLSPLLPAKYMEAACAQCHTTYDPKAFTMSYLPQMTTMTRGEKLFKDQACYGCHKIEGFSKGNVGPELTYEGRTAVVSTIAHQLWDPRYKVGSCVMPYFFSVHKPIVDANGTPHVVDPRYAHITPAEITDQDTLDSLNQHGYVPDKSRQDDVDALITFVAAQTGQNYTASQANRLAMISSFNAANPGEVAVTAESGKKLFETSGCYACHHIGDPDFKGDPMLDPKGKGGIAGPQLTWEGTRHSREWLIGHYASPQDFVPGSIMPIFPFSDSQRAALSLYDQSLRSAKSGKGTVSADVDMPNKIQLKAGAKTRDIRYMNR